MDSLKVFFRDGFRYGPSFKHLVIPGSSVDLVTSRLNDCFGPSRDRDGSWHIPHGTVRLAIYDTFKTGVGMVDGDAESVVMLSPHSFHPEHISFTTLGAITALPESTQSQNPDTPHTSRTQDSNQGS